MSLPPVVSRDEWLAARKQLLVHEKEYTRLGDALRAQRMSLPMVQVDKNYQFDGPTGKVDLVEMFEGRRQLIVYHFMWVRETGEGCTSCSVVADTIGDLSHLHWCETTLALVTRAPLADIEGFRARMGWTVPWYSSIANEFNFDFHVTNDESVAPVQYNYKDKETLERQGWGMFVNGDGHGASVFLRDGNDVYHTYSTYGRGADPLVGVYRYLDLTPLGRQRYISEFRHHDRYETGHDGAGCH
jgi:predicted dithiol-disulfide oxidoreductase (DUF899 family)